MPGIQLDIEKEKQRAVALFSGGKLDEARAVCERVCAVIDDPSMLCMLGIIHSRHGQHNECVKYLRKAVRISPGYSSARLNLANALRLIHDYAGANTEFRAVLEHEPGDCIAHYQYGLSLESTGAYRQAIDEYRKAQELNPAFLDARAGEASVLNKEGKYQEALQILLPGIEAGKQHAQIAVQYGILSRKVGRVEHAIQVLEPLVDNPVHQDEDLLQIHFVLGDLHDQLGEYDKAFAHYSSANTLKKPAYDPDIFSEKVDRMIARFSREALRNTVRGNRYTESLVFIVGMTRAGTSLVEQIISSHSSVKGEGEKISMIKIATVMEREFPDITRLTEQNLGALSADYLANIVALESNAIRYVDKLPGNFMHLGYIQLLFPGAHIIHCKRNSLDNCLSCYFQNFHQTLPETFDLASIGRFYLDYERMMQHWNQVLSLKLHEVEYEQLVADPEQEINSLVEFLGVPPEDACFRFYENERVVTTASYDQVKQPMHTRSVDRWRNYEKHLGPLLDVIGGMPEK